MSSLLQRIKHSLPGAKTNGSFYRGTVSLAAFLRAGWRAAELKYLTTFYRLPELALGELLRKVPEPVEPIRDEICMPPFVSFPHDDFGPLMAVARALDPAVIVELGTAHGNTTANLARFCLRAHIYTVNAPAETMTGELTTFRLESTTIGEIYRRHGYADRVTQIYANTLKFDLSEHLPGKADLVIIDACHDADYVESDFHKVVPFLAPHGVILFHDNHPSMAGHLCGSYLATMRLRRQGVDVRQLRDCWWGVYRADWSAAV